MISNSVPLAIVLHFWALSPHPFRKNKKTIVQCHPSKVSAPWKKLQETVPRELSCSAVLHGAEVALYVANGTVPTAMCQVPRYCSFGFALLKNSVDDPKYSKFGLKPISIDINNVFSFASSSH